MNPKVLKKPLVYIITNDLYDMIVISEHGQGSESWNQDNLKDRSQLLFPEEL